MSSCNREPSPSPLAVNRGKPIGTRTLLRLSLLLSRVSPGDSVRLISRRKSLDSEKDRRQISFDNTFVRTLRSTYMDSRLNGEEPEEERLRSAKHRDYSRNRKRLLDRFLWIWIPSLRLLQQLALCDHYQRGTWNFLSTDFFFADFKRRTQSRVDFRREWVRERRARDMEIDMSGKTNRSTEELTKRRVSISDQILGMDNPNFDHHRRISASSEHNSDHGRGKSILQHGSSSYYGSSENIPQHKFDLENGRINGRKKSAYSLTSSIRDKVEYSEELERWESSVCRSIRHYFPLQKSTKLSNRIVQPLFLGKSFCVGG